MKSTVALAFLFLSFASVKAIAVNSGTYKAVNESEAKLIRQAVVEASNRVGSFFV
jgi:hypothetical protein